GAEPAGALQRNCFEIERAGENHRAIEGDEGVGIGCPGGHHASGRAVRREIRAPAYLETRNNRRVLGRDRTVVHGRGPCCQVAPRALDNALTGNRLPPSQNFFVPLAGGPAVASARAGFVAYEVAGTLYLSRAKPA